jgi:hypothetical protein
LCACVLFDTLLPNERMAVKGIFFKKFNAQPPPASVPHHAEGDARRGGGGIAAHAVAQDELNHDRLGASRLARRQPVEAGAFRAAASRPRP